MCNLQCKHCYQDAQRALPDELDTHEAKLLVRDLAEAGSPVFTGKGEYTREMDITPVETNA